MVNQYSLQFNGTSSVVNINNGLMPNSPVYTVEFLMKSTSSTNAYRRIFTNQNIPFSTPAFAFRESVNGGFQLFIGTTSYNSPTDLDFKNKWVKIHIVSDGVKTTVYCDGQEIIKANGFQTSSSSWSIWFGGYYSNTNSEYFEGYLDDLRVYSYAKSDSEIKKYLYHEEYNEKALYSYLKFEEGSGVISANKTNPNANATLTNVVWSTDTKKLISKRMLLKSNNRIYSLKPNEILHETKMTSNTTPAPYVASASSTYSSNYPAWRAFDHSIIDPTTGINNAWITSAGVLTGWLQLDFGVKTKISGFTLSPKNTSTLNVGVQTMPKNFSLLGSNDGNNFITIKSFENESWNNHLEERFFYLDGIVNYRYYRINITANNGSASYTAIGEMKFLKPNILTEMPTASLNSFLEYGSLDLQVFNSVIANKNYILQDTVSEDTDGLWKQELDRKPLSIKIGGVF